MLLLPTGTTDKMKEKETKQRPLKLSAQVLTMSQIVKVTHYEDINNPGQ